MRLYNTLSRRLEEFVPREPGHAGVYNCGPTVYDYTHVGHLRPALLGDVLVRWLRANGYQVRYVVNFTDVDDRIIERAGREGIPFGDYAQRYIDDYLHSMRLAGVDQVDLYVRATDHIPQMLEMIAGLVARGYAYPLDGDVYFDVTKDDDYGRLSGRSLDDMLSGARIRVDERKRNPADFALWKGAKEGEPSWPSPWGPGRPGWHIECSAMTRQYLGHGFDIHLGGDDLIFPHHENEIAQSECFAGQAPLARYWLHNAMVDVADEKMSKSLGNSVVLHDVLDKYPAAALRVFLLSAHYRKPLEFSEDAVAEARRAWDRLRNAREALEEAERAVAASAPAGQAEGGRAQPAADVGLSAQASEARATFTAAMNDDLNTPLALASLFDLARASNAALHNQGADSGATRGIRDAAEALQELGDILGIWVGWETARPVPAEGLAARLVQILVTLRDEARGARDWSLADRIRDDLEEAGVLLEDTPRGTRWKWRR